MSKFASSPAVSTRKARSGQVITNVAGGPGYAPSAKLDFVSILLTTFVQDQFYRSENGTILRVKELLGAVDPVFAAQAAVFARNEFGMRSISHVVAGEIAKSVKGQPWTRAFFNSVCRRADDPAEVLAYYMATYGKPIPNALKRGLADAYGRYSEYELAKYQRAHSAFTMVDALNMVRGIKPFPKKKDGFQDGRLSPALGKLVRGELSSQATWESQLIQAGQTDDAEAKEERKADAWASLVKEKKLGYLALLRNLRNILAADSSLVTEVCNQLRNEKAIRKSLVFPFQVHSAYEVIEGLGSSQSRLVTEALDDAVDLACGNVPRLEGESVVFLDVSGSMGGRVAKIASIFAAVICKAWNADLIQFDTSARYIPYSLKDTTMTLARKFSYNGGGTDMPSAIKAMNKPYARVLILSDMQTWVGGVSHGNPHAHMAEYSRKFGVKPFIYSFDLQGQGSLGMPEGRVAALAGFAGDKLFKIMSLLEQDREALVHAIEKVEFGTNRSR